MSESIFTIKLGGSEIDSSLASAIERVTVDDTLDVPSYFLIAFRDKEQTILKDAKFKIGDEAQISVKVGGVGPEKIFHGEITAFELQMIEGGIPLTVVRGYDPTHRLHGRPSTVAYLKKGYDEIVKEVLNRVGAKPGTVQRPAGQPPEVVTQLGESDWHFLARLARLTGHLLDVKDNKVDFKAPDEASRAAQPRGDLDQKGPLEISLGADVKELRAVLTAGGQVKEVEVRGWDPAAKKVIKQTAKVETGLVQVKEKPAALAGKFKAAKFIAAGAALSSQAEVKEAAKALAEQIAAGFAELDGTVEGNPKLKAGETIALANVGKPFVGKYTLSAVQHVYTPRGYRTQFRVSGHQDRSLLALTSGGSGGGSAGGGVASANGTGVTIGEVTDIDDPDKLGRVKMKLPRYDDKYVSSWARVVYPGAGKGENTQRGLFTLPKVGDEVLVAFEHGDVNYPVVIGGLYNGKDKGVPENYPDTSKGRSNELTLTSDVGHKVQLHDKAGEEGILIVSADGKMKIHLSQKDQKILINCDHPNGVEVISKGPALVKADKDAKLETATNFDLVVKGNAKFTVSGNLEMKAGGNLKVEATGNASYKSTGNTEMTSSGTMKLESSSKLDAKSPMSTLDGSGVCTIKGGMVKIN